MHRGTLGLDELKSKDLYRIFICIGNWILPHQKASCDWCWTLTLAYMYDHIINWYLFWKTQYYKSTTQQIVVHVYFHNHGLFSDSRITFDSCNISWYPKWKSCWLHRSLFVLLSMLYINKATWWDLYLIKMAIFTQFFISNIFWWGILHYITEWYHYFLQHCATHHLFWHATFDIIQPNITHN